MTKGRAKVRPFAGCEIRNAEAENRSVPIRRPITDRLVRILNRKVKHDPEGRTIADLMGEVIVLKALKGDIRAFKEIMTAVEGRVEVRFPVTSSVANRRETFCTVVPKSTIGHVA